MIRNWEKKLLGPRINILSGYPFASENFTNEDGFPLLRIRDLNDKDTEVNYNGQFSKEYVVKKGDLLVGMDGDFHTVLWKGREVLLNQRVCKIKSKDEHDIITIFLYYRLINEIKKINDTVSATTVKHLSIKDILNLCLQLPTNEEQRLIADVLCTIDALIEQTEELMAKYQRIKTGLMQDLLTKGIDSKGNVRSRATHTFKVKNGIEVPENWEVKTFIELLYENVIGEIQDGNHGEKHPKGSDFVTDGIPFVMASDISKSEIDVENCKKITPEQFTSLRIGFAMPQDILLSHKASIGFVAVVPNSLNEIMLTPQVTYYRIKDKQKLSYKYLSWYMRGEGFQNELSNLAKQSTRDYIGILMQRNLTLAYPMNIEEQAEISKKIQSIDDYLNTESKKLSKLNSLKTGLMQDLLSGKVKVKY